MQPRRDVALGAYLRQAADQPLHGPQQHLHLHLGARAGLRQVADDTRCREGEQQRRGLRVLDVNRLRPKAFALLVTDPLDQCVDVGVGRHVGRDHPQRRAVAGVVAVQRAVERQPFVVELGRRRDDRRTAVEQPCDHRGRDRTLRSACHDSDFVAGGTRVRVLRARGDPAVQRRVDLTARRQRLALPPGRLGRDDVAGALEPLRQPEPVGVDVALVRQPELDQILTGAGPAVVEDDGLLGVEHRRHQTWPVRAQFGGDQVDELGIGGRRRRDDRVVQAQLAQHQPGRRGEHTVAAGDLVGEFAQRGRVDGRAATTAGGRQGHRMPWRAATEPPRRR